MLRLFKISCHNEISDLRVKLASRYILGLRSDQVVPKAEEFEELLSVVSYRTPSFLEATSVLQLPAKPMSGSSSHIAPHSHTQVQTSKCAKFNFGTSFSSTSICYNCRKLRHVVAKRVSAKNTLMTDVVDDAIDEEDIFCRGFCRFCRTW